MSTSADSSKISLETVLNLKDRLKHGQNVTKILESQLDTAQHNISLLQGQIRLANETILNLKKHFRETENILSQCLSPDQLAKWNSYENDTKDSDATINKKNSSVDSTTRSPLPSGAIDSSKGFEEKSDTDKSPYAIQLRQVLDVLDEEPRKHPQQDGHKDCNCSDCQLPSQKRYDDCDCGNTSYSGDQYYHHKNEDIDHYHHHHRHRKNEEYCKSKYKINGHTSRSDSPKSYGRSESHAPHTAPYSNTCSGPCCVNSGSPSYKILDKPGALHYSSINSPQRIHDKHNDRHSHCSDKCQSHYVNYVPYGYHVTDGVPAGMPESLQPLSPSRRKRPYMHLIPADEPPHLKYTKVKRIDGSKLTAQKVLQDFTRRRFLPYNPRYDLDLLIVPPPIPATELVKKKSVTKQYNESDNTAALAPSSLQNQNFHDCEETSLDKVNGVESSPKNTNSHLVSNSRNNDNNNNNNNNNDTLTPTASDNMIFKNNYNPIKALPAIKEEHEEGRTKLENHINKLHDSYPVHNRPKSPQRNSYYGIEVSPNQSEARMTEVKK